jgi:hypothetical protein
VQFLEEGALHGAAAARQVDANVRVKRRAIGRAREGVLLRGGGDGVTLPARAGRREEVATGANGGRGHIWDRLQADRVGY